jgi:hypothetical protein
LKSHEFRTALAQLGLTQIEAARLLSVAPRTARRWAEDNAQEIPGPAAHALRAWIGLQRHGLPWRPGDYDADQVVRFRDHCIELYELLLRVERRGGPSGTWLVDLDKGTATLGPMHVSFYKLVNGGFSPGSYRRKDGPANWERDWPLLEDAYACIAKAFAEQESAGFVFLVSLQDKNVLLWDVQKVPTVVMRISCDLIRETVCRDTVVTDDQCRLLVECNKELASRLAETMYTARRYEIRNDKIRVLHVEARDLNSIADRFSKSVLRVMPIWGPNGKRSSEVKGA